MLIILRWHTKHVNFKLGVQYPFKERGHRNKTRDTLWPQFQSKNEEPWESAEYAKMCYV